MKVDFTLSPTINGGQRPTSLAFVAQKLAVINNSNRIVYVREGGSDNPSASNADYQIPAGSFAMLPVNAKEFGFAMSAIAVVTVPTITLSQLSNAATIILTTDEEVTPSMIPLMPPIPPQYYDRNPTIVNRNYETDISNVANDPPSASPVSLWTYTVVANRQAWIQSSLCVLIRRAAATTVNLAKLMQNKSGYGINQASLRTNASGDKDSSVIGQAGVIRAGETLEGSYSDGSTGGTIYYHNAMTAIEFDI